MAVANNHLVELYYDECEILTCVVILLNETPLVKLTKTNQLVLACAGEESSVKVRKMNRSQIVFKQVKPNGLLTKHSDKHLKCCNNHATVVAAVIFVVLEYGQPCSCLIAFLPFCAFFIDGFSSTGSLKLVALISPITKDWFSKKN